MEKYVGLAASHIFDTAAISQQMLSAGRRMIHNCQWTVNTLLPLNQNFSICSSLEMLIVLVTKSYTVNLFFLLNCRAIHSNSGKSD